MGCSPSPSPCWRWTFAFPKARGCYPHWLCCCARDNVAEIPGLCDQLPSYRFLWISHHRKFRYVIGYNRSLLVSTALPYGDRVHSLPHLADQCLQRCLCDHLLRGHDGRRFDHDGDPVGICFGEYRLIEPGLSKKVIHSETILPLITGGSSWRPSVSLSSIRTWPSFPESLSCSFPCFRNEIRSKIVLEGT